MRISGYLLTAFLFPALLAGQASTYQPGEKVNYEVRYGVLQGGVASLNLRPTPSAEGRYGIQSLSEGQRGW